jgi:hypothetical protein
MKDGDFWILVTHLVVVGITVGILLWLASTT